MTETPHDGTAKVYLNIGRRYRKVLACGMTVAGARVLGVIPAYSLTQHYDCSVVLVDKENDVVLRTTLGPQASSRPQKTGFSLLLPSRDASPRRGHINARVIDSVNSDITKADSSLEHVIR